MTVVDPRDVPGSAAFHEDVEAYAWDRYLEALAAESERFFAQITGRHGPGDATASAGAPSDSTAGSLGATSPHP